MLPITKFSLFGIRLAVIVLAAYWILIFAGTHVPKLPHFSAEIGDKTKHFSAFFGLAMLLCYVTNSPNRARRFAGIAILCLSYAMIDELTQNLVPNRVAEIGDFVADSLGTGSAIAIYVGIPMLFARIPKLTQRVGSDQSS